MFVRQLSTVRTSVWEIVCHVIISRIKSIVTIVTMTYHVVIAPILCQFFYLCCYPAEYADSHRPSISMTPSTKALRRFFSVIQHSLIGRK